MKNNSIAHQVRVFLGLPAPNLRQARCYRGYRRTSVGFPCGCLGHRVARVILAVLAVLDVAGAVRAARAARAVLDGACAPTAPSAPSVPVASSLPPVVTTVPP